MTHPLPHRRHGTFFHKAPEVQGTPLSPRVHRMQPPTRPRPESNDLRTALKKRRIRNWSVVLWTTLFFRFEPLPSSKKRNMVFSMLRGGLAAVRALRTAVKVEQGVVLVSARCLLTWGVGIWLMVFTICRSSCSGWKLLRCCVAGNKLVCVAHPVHH